MRMLAVCAGVALAAGCASTPPANDALEEARTAYRSAQADPHVPRLASTELDEAGRSLNQAEALWREGAHPMIIAHQAYLAEQRARIARQTAMARAAEAELEQRAEARQRDALETRARAQTEDAEQARREAMKEQAEAAQLRAEVQRLQAELAELDARPSERGWVLSLGAEVLFDVGEATLKPGGRRALEQLASFLEQQPERGVAIEGFTDSTGGAALNQRLSERRALAVRDALVRMGVDRERLTTRGLGAAFPVASNDTPAGRQLNRRVEIVIAEDAAQAATGGSR